MKSIMLINVKMPIRVGILTFISMLTITSAIWETRIIVTIQHFSFLSSGSLCSVELSMRKSFKTSGLGFRPVWTQHSMFIYMQLQTLAGNKKTNAENEGTCVINEKIADQTELMHIS